jgi:hypothetical protein
MTIAAWPTLENPLVVVRWHDDGSVSVTTTEEVPLLYRSIASICAFNQLMYGVW